ncbi:hypothetical protein ACJX0J_025809, partial [Zea mays]
TFIGDELGKNIVIEISKTSKFQKQGLGKPEIRAVPSLIIKFFLFCFFVSKDGNFLPSNSTFMKIVDIVTTRTNILHRVVIIMTQGFIFCPIEIRGLQTILYLMFKNPRIGSSLDRAKTFFLRRKPDGTMGAYIFLGTKQGIRFI